MNVIDLDQDLSMNLEGFRQRNPAQNEHQVDGGSTGMVAVSDWLLGLLLSIQEPRPMPVQAFPPK